MLFGLRKGIVSIYHHIKINPTGKQRGKIHGQQETATCRLLSVGLRLFTPDEDLASQ